MSTGGGTLEERLLAYAEAGFESVEFMLGHVKDYLHQGHSVADVRRLLDAHHLHCIGGFETSLEAFSPPDQRAQNHRQHVENARLLAELGATIMVVGTDGPADLSAAADPLGELASAFGDVARQIEDTGITLSLEFNWSPVVKSLRTAAEVARRSDSAAVGVLFDPAHYHCTPSKFEQLDARNVAMIKHVHVDDMTDKPGELFQLQQRPRSAGIGLPGLARPVRPDRDARLLRLFFNRNVQRRTLGFAPSRSGKTHVRQPAAAV